MDQSRTSKLIMYHQYNSLQGFQMTDEYMLTMLKANEQIIKQAKGADAKWKSIANASESNSSNAPHSLYSFERYIFQKIKDQRRIKKAQSSRKPAETKPMVRGTALNLPPDTILVSQKLCKWMGGPEMEKYFTNRDLLERRRQREKELEEYELMRVQENQLKLEALKELNIKNQRYIFQATKSIDGNNRTLDRSPRFQQQKSEDQTSKTAEKSHRKSSFSMTIPNTTQNTTLNPRPAVHRRKLKPKVEKKQQFILDQFIQSQTFRREQNYSKLAAQLKSLRSQCVTILNKNSILFEMNGTTNRQMASLTKIMTCILTLMLCKKYGVELTSVIKVSRKAASMNGTTAELQAGDKLTVLDLLHGMMLPSGNDAAYALADHFGRVIFQRSDEFKQKKEKSLNKDTLDGNPEKIYSNTETNLQYFVGQMNALAQYLKLEHTRFSNPHGLPDKQNKSTSNDLAYLCYYSMKNPQFRKIVKTTQYKCQVFNANMKLKRQMSWKNTNKLLQLEHCEGIKTGITSSAGPCMASAFAGDKFQVIIIILKTNSLSNRFKEASFLFKWSLQKFRDRMALQQSS